MLPPRFPRQELQRLMNFGALSRGFGTCCLRFKTGVATTPARLASGWLARLYREGVEPSGSLQKVSDRSLILLFWIYPGAREGSCRRTGRDASSNTVSTARPNNAADACGNVEAQCFRRLEIDHQFVLGRRLHWQVGGLLALEDAIDIRSRAPDNIDSGRGP